MGAALPLPSDAAIVVTEAPHVAAGATPVIPWRVLSIVATMTSVIAAVTARGRWVLLLLTVLTDAPLAAGCFSTPDANTATDKRNFGGWQTLRGLK